MNALLEKIRSEYVNKYGETTPAYYCDMVFSVLQHQPVPGYKGCRIEDSKIIFEFSDPNTSSAYIRLIDIQFRNRLSRKISYASSENDISVFISDFIEERGEYLTTAIDLDNYFRGKGATLKLRAEYNLYQAHKDWRNSELVEQEIKKIYEEIKK